MKLLERIKNWWDRATAEPVDQVDATEQTTEIHIPVRGSGEALYKCNGCNEFCVAPENEAKQCPHCGSSSLTFQNRV